MVSLPKWWLPACMVAFVFALGWGQNLTPQTSPSPPPAPATRSRRKSQQEATRPDLGVGAGGALGRSGILETRCEGAAASVPPMFNVLLCAVPTSLFPF